MTQYLDFEKPLAEVEGKAEELRALARSSEGMDVSAEAKTLDEKAHQMLDDLYKSLTPWRKCQVARHPDRPHCKDYIEALFTEYTPLAGDRNFADDLAVMGGLARFNDTPVVVIGHEKGNDTKSRIERNFGMARPEGYRKAVRLMELADKFGLPVITLVDTPGAYPGKGAEERGQSEAIARATEKCLQIGVPLVSVIIGEGGSGGAVAFATANRVAMLEHSVYSVISPEGCASILWKDAEKMREAAEALRLTAQDLKQLGVNDRIIPEPRGGAHRDRKEAIASVRKAIAAMEARYRSETGISALKIKHNGVLGYFIEVPARHGDALMKPDSGFTHRQTMANAGRFNSVHLHEEASRIAEAGGHALAAEEAHFEALVEAVVNAREAIARQGLGRSHITVLDALLKLRQVCCDPRLVKLEAARRVQESAKLELLMEMLPELLEEGRKVLVFSQFRQMLSLIEEELQQRNIHYSVLTGQTRDRDAAIERFKRDDCNLFLISLKAGGVGLNLTEADTVILYDPWWNPAAEAQAADRSHRIGQDKPVFVYKLITENSVEDRILAMQQRKQALADGVYQDEADEPLTQLDADSLNALFAPLDD